MVKSAWWAAAVQPVILSLGAVLGALDQDVLNISWLPFINKQDYIDEPPPEETKETKKTE